MHTRCALVSCDRRRTKKFSKVKISWWTYRPVTRGKQDGWSHP